MKVAVGSKNPVKIEAVKRAFEIIWPEKKWDVLGVEVSSGVSNQPMSDLESIKGATTRAKRAIKALKADFGVGLEGGLQKIKKDWFDCGWIVVINKKGEMGMGSSIRMHAPRRMMELVKKGMELGDANDLIFRKVNTKQSEGHFGLMTKNAITRTTAYRDGVIAALSYFLHTHLF
ncbi:hypothetical protein A3E66_02065 [Candidatus Daviesbacteria bacterium RIFCSPHIGHO2_12_FULL_37_16]|nr:MAG: hypothetical protein A3C99_00680 [Candidatus Daviesbacteria bacterium RIFCSPHIGHO2_02_FULL_37_9]OGE36695.1 MAG: hypothetical protein A3E66_02065 [Candidatus Daviesbacteria bacterium RIFCSPHIGHO2_12_FULL_37_16]